MDMDPFRTLIRTEGVRLYRDLPWRRTRDPYEIWLSEVMLQQTQVARVETRWVEWLDRFPSVFALAEAGTAEVLAAWQGMGYNRRALALKAAAEQIAFDYDGVFPTEVKELVALPGIGPATAQGIRAFAFDLPGVYLETNVRTVVLHHLFPDVPSVPDKELVPIVEATCPAGLDSLEKSSDVDGGPLGAYAVPQDEDDTPRSWYYAMLDYGAYLKKTVPNPSRRARAYTRQSKFEGSRRQKRAEIVRMLLAAGELGEGMDAPSVHAALCASERDAGRAPVERELVESILSRARAYTRQSKFEGSRRQKRAEIVRMLLAAGELGEGMDAPSVHAALCASERDAGRAPVERELVESILSDLEREGFCRENEGVWRIA